MKEDNSSQGFVDCLVGKEQETKGVISEKGRNIGAAAERHPELDQDAYLHSHTITTIILRPAQPGESLKFRLLRAPNILQPKRGDRFTFQAATIEQRKRKNTFKRKGSLLHRGFKSGCQHRQPAKTIILNPLSLCYVRSGTLFRESEYVFDKQKWMDY